MKKTPVAVIGFVRSDVLDETLARLSECETVLERDIFVYLSAPRHAEEKMKTDAVLKLVESYKATKLPNIIIIQRDKNEGAGRNIRHAIADVITKFGRVIVIEDDVLVSRTFLNFMDQALEFYKDDKRVWCVNGHRQPYHEFPKKYPYDVYLNPRNMSWGWGTWIDRWESVDFSMKMYPEFISRRENFRRLADAGADIPAMLKKVYNSGIDTWDVQCSFHMVANELYGVEPIHSLTKNVGFCKLDSVNCTRPNGILSGQKYYDYRPRLVSVDEMLVKERPFMRYFKYNVSERRLFRFIVRLALRYLKYYLGPQNNLPV